MHEGKHGIIDQWDDQLELFAEADDRAGKASKKKGCIALKKDNILKVTYSHRNSEMEGLGEKLVRWIRSDGSMVPVARFIPVLAQSDLISRMDQHVWEMAVKQLAAWKGTALEHLYLSINVDPRAFFYMDVPDCLSGLCNRYGVDVSMLHVEVTENALAEGQNLPEDALDSLRKRGFVLEIDDFGKGSSSLSMLKDVPVDVLKIDMGFLRETEHEIRSRIILESVIQMADKLETPVIVEGVETPEQEESIRNMGCEMYQGFLFSKPIPVDVFEALYLKTRPESAK